MSYSQPLVFLLGVLMGTGSTITVKVMYGMQAVGLSGELQRFEKPLLTTWIMFIAMTIALPVHYAMEWRQHRQAAEYNRLKGAAGGAAAAGTEVKAPEPVPWRTLMLLVIPSCFDLLGTALASIGLLFTTVSVYQLVRCSVIIVTRAAQGHRAEAPPHHVHVAGHRAQHCSDGAGVDDVVPTQRQRRRVR